MPAEPDCRTAAVVVTWNGAELLSRNLPSLLGQSRPFWRIIVVDNGSSDESLAYLDGQPGVDTLVLSANRGFACAANLGIRRALETGADCLALVNNDVVLAADWHEQALRALGDHPDLSGCATCLLEANPPETVDTAGIDWSDEGWAQDHLHGSRAPDPADPVRPVFGVSAAAGLFRRELFARVGLFDESFFAYQEDVDLAVRARRRGCAFALAPAARGWHLGRGSNRPFPLAGTWADYYNARNRLAVLAKSVPSDHWRRSWRRILVTQLSALARSVPEGRWAAVMAGFTHGALRLPASLRARFRATEAAPSTPSETLHPS